jgi:hypothetical protein
MTVNRYFRVISNFEENLVNNYRTCQLTNSFYDLFIKNCNMTFISYNTKCNRFFIRNSQGFGILNLKYVKIEGIKCKFDIIKQLAN